MTRVHFYCEHIHIATVHQNSPVLLSLEFKLVQIGKGPITIGATKYVSKLFIGANGMWVPFCRLKLVQLFDFAKFLGLHIQDVHLIKLFVVLWVLPAKKEHLSLIETRGNSVSRPKVNLVFYGKPGLLKLKSTLLKGHDNLPKVIKLLFPACASR